MVPRVSAAGPIIFGDYVTETIMEVQSQEQLLLQAAVPWKPGDVVKYQYSYDFASGAFSFSTIPGQVIAGNPFSFSTTATLDSTAGAWSWSGAGFEGATSFSIAGLATLSGDPKEDISGKYTDSAGHSYDATANVDITETPCGDPEHPSKCATSTGFGQATDAAGKVIQKGRVTDVQSFGAWEISFTADDPGGAIKSQLDFGFESQLGPTTFEGDFTQTNVPEPATWAMMLVGLFALGGRLRSRRRSGRANEAFVSSAVANGVN